MLKKFFILTGALCLVFCGLPSTNIYALEEDSIVNIEYLDDGTYYETILEEAMLLERSSSKSGKKTVTYKSSDGTILWSVTNQNKNSNVALQCIRKIIISID